MAESFEMQAFNVQAGNAVQAANVVQAANAVQAVNLDTFHVDLKIGSESKYDGYSSGPYNSVVLNKRGGWTIHPKLINVWSEISTWSDFSMIYLKEFCTKTKDYCLKF